MSPPVGRDTVDREAVITLILGHAVDLGARGWPKRLVPHEHGESDAIRATYAEAIRSLPSSPPSPVDQAMIDAAVAREREETAARFDLMASECRDQLGGFNAPNVRRTIAERQGVWRQAAAWVRQRGPTDAD